MNGGKQKGGRQTAECDHTDDLHPKKKRRKGKNQGGAPKIRGPRRTLGPDTREGTVCLYLGLIGDTLQKVIGV